LSSRTYRHMAVSLISVLLVTLGIAVPASSEPTNPKALEANRSQVTIMSTTDLHAHAFNWNYLQDQPFSAGRGLARISTMVEQVRSERAPGSTLLIDNGDTIQGTTLGRYFATVDPITAGAQRPMAAAMNHIGYDTMTLGNHEFNFGLPTLREFEAQLDATVLGGNVLTAGTDEPAFAPYEIKTVNLPGNKPIRVGILGLTTPGSAIWDRTHVQGNLDFVDGVETAHRYVPEMRAQGVDIVVAALHTGLSTGSSYGDQLPYLENFATVVAEEVPGIDVLIAGHSHTNVPQRLVTNKVTGDQVVVSQAGSHGQRLGVTDLTLQKVRGQWTVSSAEAFHLNASNFADDPAILDLIGPAHQRVVDYVNAPVATSLQELTLRNSMTEDVAAIDMMALVQLERTREGLAGTPYADLPLISARSPLTTSPVTVPAGEVNVRQLSSLYVYDNNVLMAVKVNGAEVVEFLEWVASFYHGVTDAGPHSRSSLVRSGVSAQWFTQHVYGLTYDIDLTQPVGQRLVNVRYQGEPIDPAQDFILTTDNYVVGGGGDAPVLPQAEVVFNPLESIQELISVWAAERGVIDTTEFHTVDWRLVAGDEPIQFTD
jgi:2',3'-cyclic-nucleotide 2'-phosphodiesterase / 3'-nucleotidase